MRALEVFQQTVGISFADGLVVAAALGVLLGVYWWALESRAEA